jgi:hypothetical protein
MLMEDMFFLTEELKRKPMRINEALIFLHKDISIPITFSKKAWLYNFKFT